MQILFVLAFVAFVASMPLLPMRQHLQQHCLLPSSKSDFSSKTRRMISLHPV